MPMTPLAMMLVQHMGKVTLRTQRVMQVYPPPTPPNLAPAPSTLLLMSPSQSAGRGVDWCPTWSCAVKLGLWVG